MGTIGKKHSKNLGRTTTHLKGNLEGFYEKQFLVLFL